jgi:hypothetical protein
MTRAEWAHNASTGHDILRISGNERVIRTSHARGVYTYVAEFWGDYSLRYPIKGPHRATLPKAKRDLSDLRK